MVNATDDFEIGSVVAEVPTAGGVIQVPLALDNGIFRAIFVGPPDAGDFNVTVKVTDIVGQQVQSLALLTILPGSDLVIQNITFAPQVPITGDFVNVSAIIENIGGKFANNVNITFLAD